MNSYIDTLAVEYSSSAANGNAKSRFAWNAKLAVSLTLIYDDASDHYFDAAQGFSYSRVKLDLATVQKKLIARLTETGKKGDTAARDYVEAHAKNLFDRLASDPVVPLYRSEIVSLGAGSMCRLKGSDSIGVVPGSIIGLPLGLLGFAVVTPFCLISDPFLFYDYKVKHNGDSLEEIFWCHVLPFGAGFELGYEAGSRPFLKTKERMVFHSCATGAVYHGGIIWE